MKTRAQRRADYEKRTKRGIKRWNANTYVGTDRAMEIPAYKKRKMFLKAWCSCDFCNPCAFGQRTLAERRCEPVRSLVNELHD